MEQKNRECLFGKRNYVILLTGALLIVAGYLLMSGKGSTLSSYNPDIFSKLRIQVAPLLCLTGYLINIVGLLVLPFYKKDT